MEKLHSVRRPHDEAEGEKGFSTQRLPRSMSQRVADWLRPQRCSFLYWKVDFHGEDSQLLFDCDYQSSSVFHEDAGLHFDPEFESTIAVKGDEEFTIDCRFDVFDCSETDYESAPECELPFFKNIMVENDARLTSYCTRFSQSGFAAQKFRSLAFGCAVHLAALSLCIAMPTPSASGLQGNAHEWVAVKLLETCDVDTPDRPSPASVDSPASCAVQARKDQQPELETKKTDPAASEAPVRPDELKPEPHREDESENKPTPTLQAALPDRSVEKGPHKDSPSLHDSVDSTPSIASPEKKGRLKAGDAERTYKDRILKAIHEAAFYPRSALSHKAHGKTLVSFTINKDGSVSNVCIAARSDSKILDKAALEIVQKASSHFPPIPESFMKDQVSYEVPIVFKKRL